MNKCLLWEKAMSRARRDSVSIRCWHAHISVMDSPLEHVTSSLPPQGSMATSVVHFSLWGILHGINGETSWCFGDCGIWNKLVILLLYRSTHQYCWAHCCWYSVAQSCPAPCDPMSCSTPGFPVLRHLPQLAQTHVHWGSDAIQPSHPLSSPSPPALNLYQHQGLFKWVSSSHEVAKVLEFQLQHQSFQWTPRADLLQDGLVVSPCSPRDSQESSPTPQFKSINSSFSTQLSL